MEEDAKSQVEENGNLKLLNILTAVLVVFITIALFALWCKCKARRSILLVGISGSGKTVIYSRLVHNKFVETYTSIKENIAEITNDYGSWRIVDIPGDERLRYKYFDQYKSSARGLVFVIDSVTIEEQIRDVTDYLHTILSDSDIVRRKIPILIVCNKQDQKVVKKRIAVKTFLEKELWLQQEIKSKQLGEDESVPVKVKFIHHREREKSFDFADMKLKIDLAESYAFSNDPETPFDLTELKEWLHQIGRWK